MLHIGNNNKHIGNEQLRNMARSYVYVYSVSTKKEKSDISRSLVHHIRSLDPPGRFLKRVGPNNKCWYDVGDDAAREKASQALRDAVAVVERETGSSDKDEDSFQEEVESRSKRHIIELENHKRRRLSRTEHSIVEERGRFSTPRPSSRFRENVHQDNYHRRKSSHQLPEHHHHKPNSSVDHVTRHPYLDISKHPAPYVSPEDPYYPWERSRDSNRNHDRDIPDYRNQEERHHSHSYNDDPHDMIAGRYTGTNSFEEIPFHDNHQCHLDEESSDISKTDNSAHYTYSTKVSFVSSAASDMLHHEPILSPYVARPTVVLPPSGTNDDSMSKLDCFDIFKW